MTTSKPESLMHPVRLRILQTMQGRQLTPYQLNALLPEIPQATLYRHLRILNEANVVRVVSTRPVHGATESLYELVENAGSISPEEFAAIRPQQHKQFFQQFVGSILGTFDTYVETRPEDSYADGLRYFCTTLNLTDEEFLELWAEFRTLISKRIDNKPAPGRKRRLIASQAIPVIETENKNQR